MLAVVVEVQCGRDPAKAWSWPVYVATVRARLRCPAMLVVVSPDRRAARWCRQPIAMGPPRWVLEPVVLGPDAVPLVTDVDRAAAEPSLAVLSCVAHCESGHRDRLLQAFLGAMDAIDPELGHIYTDILFGALPDVARSRMEALMAAGSYKFKSDFALRYFGEGRAEGVQAGRAEGEAQALLTVLKARGLEVSPAIRKRVLGCGDATQLTRWLKRAVTAENTTDVFG